ncbi:MAG: hypothetical protein A2152_01630 [Candidatus Levybacteria bacterium RBG_16_35_6]|nr:MAG: hypothetical protein A2152_01630 [Candidatus Levybacteria bacterium RBG_16_35_6]
MSIIQKVKKIIIPIVIVVFLIVGTIIAVSYGKGYRFGFTNGRPDVSGTGLLVATSLPDGAQVFINDHLTTATDNTINLFPGTYKVKIAKEGYFPWEKTLIIKKEVVTKAEALLFPIAPKLESITTTGVSNPVLDPSLIKIAYTVSSQSATNKNGAYILDMSSRPILTLQGASTQIVSDSINSFSEAKLAWSPDGSQLIATVSALSLETIYLLDPKGFNQTPSDITETMTTVINPSWQRQQTERDNAQLNSLPSKVKKLVSDNFKILSWSYDETKILYLAVDDMILPTIINPRMVGANSTPEQRDIKKDAVYVYDIKEDRNYKILDSLTDSENPLAWFPDSKHLIFVHNQKVDIMEYDATNLTTVYAGPFEDRYVFSWPDGSKIVILTNLGNPTITPNLYTISLK